MNLGERLYRTINESDNFRVPNLHDAPSITDQLPENYSSLNVGETNSAEIITIPGSRRRVINTEIREFFFLTEPEMRNNHSYRLSIRVFLIFLIIFIAELSIFIVSVTDITWFSYCYWDFSLNQATGRESSINVGSGSNEISHLYDTICDINHDLFPECPHLCTSLEPLKGSSSAYLPLSVIAISQEFIMVGFLCFKLFRQTFRLMRFKICVYNILALLIYYALADFSRSFDRTTEKNNATNFTMGNGMILSILELGIMIFHVIAYWIILKPALKTEINIIALN